MKQMIEQLKFILMRFYIERLTKGKVTLLPARLNRE